MHALTEPEAWTLAQALDLDVEDMGICLACLGSVAFPLRAGNQRELRRALRYFTPILWEEGLEAPTLTALERARAARLPRAEAAAADVEARGSGSPIVRQVVLRLAGDLIERTGLELSRLGYVTFEN
jgi:hypothetical protein